MGADRDATDHVTAGEARRRPVYDSYARLSRVPETPVFATDRLLISGERRMLHRLYVPLPTAAQVCALETDPFRTPGETYRELVAAGLDITWTESVQATIPAPDDAASLHSTPGAAILITRRTATDPAGRPLVLEETRRSAEGVQLTYRITPAWTVAHG